MSYSLQTMTAFSAAIGSLHSPEAPIASSADIMFARGPLGGRDRLNDDETYLVELLETHRNRLAKRPSLPAAATSPSPENACYFRLCRHGLTRRQCEVVFWIAQGKRDAEIGSILGCTPKTVSKHVENILGRLGAETRLGAAHTAQAWLWQER